MKRILISEEQERLINEALLCEEAVSKLPMHLQNDIKSNSTSLSDCDIFSNGIGRYSLNKLITERFNEVLAYFSDDVSQVTGERVANKIEKLISICQKKEKPIKEQLEKLCFDTLLELFDIPEDSFEFECHLVDKIDDDKDFRVYPEPKNVKTYLDSTEIKNDNLEFQKRRIINALFIGGAMRISDKARTLYLNKVFELDEELPHLYSRLIKLNELYLFLSVIKISDKEHKQGGYVEVELPTDDVVAKINANAIVFPILLDQCIQGVMELFASFGLPDEQNLANKILEISDALIFEPWDMRIGPALFDSLFKKIPHMDTTELPYIFKRIVELKPTDFMKLIEEAVGDTETGNRMMNILYYKGNHDKDYESFENGIMKKQDDTLIIDDIS